MKNSTYHLYILICSILILNSCVQDDDFKVPELEIAEPEISGNIIDIDAVLGIYHQNDELFTFTESSDYVEGYVISSDAAGNFFKQLIIQDKPENPTAGIAIEVDVNPLSAIYPFGMKVYIKLEGLSVGLDNGVIKLGRADGNQISRISSSQLDEYIIRTPRIETIIPRQINMTELSDEVENLYMRFNNVQFSRFEVNSENSKTFASDDLDEFDGERILESCEVNRSIVLSTSTFADFKSLRLPAGSGYLDGILTRDFFDDFYTVYLNSPTDIHFDSSNRCDYEPFSIAGSINCENLPLRGQVIFNENFDLLNTIPVLRAAGWIDENISDGSTKYTIGSFSGNRYPQITGFNSAEYIIDSWLVTPPIDLDKTSTDFFKFDLQASYSNGKILSVLFTTNYSGKIETTDWYLLEDVSIPIGPSSGFGPWVQVNAINTSCIQGSEVRFAFRYQGSDPSGTTRYHIDNVKVIGE
ncbi:hypothetical protein SAMN03097699_2484 [Flavobacteriaceae bacterium MAR_2010_188]|nr:hypothetical protein SAMN03097699_2484 [Flavobacteriaceae bacterium MAR_2010_188]